MSASERLILLEHIDKVFEMGTTQVRALDDVSLEITRGEMVAIMGPSGSGKSTLMNVMGCLDRPTRGRFWLGNEDVSDLTDNELARIRNRRIGFVFQMFNLLPRTSALENVELPLVYAGARERRMRAIEALERVGLGERVRHRPNELSGGEQQRVAIARAIVTDPDIILADEPTGNLDSKSSAEIMELLRDFHTAGRTVITVTHEEGIAAYAQRVIRMLDGMIVSDTRREDMVEAEAAAARA